MRYKSAAPEETTAVAAEPKKPVFYSRTSKRPTEAAPSGTAEADIYEVEIDTTGHKHLVKTGKTNTYEKIQASLESTKIETIMRRAAGGDLTALAVTNGQYLDCTDMPHSLAEAQNMLIKLEAQFNKLPLEIRQKYDMSAEKYIADYGTENWAKNLGILDQVDLEEPKEEPNSES